MLISLIFPTFNEEENLNELYKRFKTILAKLNNYGIEFVFVDDCSTDNTPEILSQLQKEDQRIKIIRFARNCGSHAALAAGLTHCKGDCAIVMAADLQDPPEIILKLIDEWKNKNKIVWGIRTKRKGEKFLTKICSKIYYRLMNWLTNVKMSPLGTDVFLADRIAINAFRQITEKHTSIFVTMAWLGFSQSSIEYEKEARFAGRSKWTLKRRIKLTIDSILAFSDIPIRYMSVVGVLTAFLGFIYAAFILWGYVQGIPIEGWSRLTAVILVIGGFQMTMLGILGEYLWRTFDESRKRPRYIIDYIIE